MIFIELTTYMEYSNIDDDRDEYGIVSFNPAQITTMERYNGWTTITMTNGNSFIVCETPREIANLIKTATNNSNIKKL